MMSIIDQIKEKINKKINPENIVLIDNSSLHSKHKFYDPKKLHLKIVINSKKLKNMGKIEAHKLIFSVLKDEMNKTIHALEIEIN